MVIPLYNEEDNVDVLIDTIRQNVLPLKVSYEIILVDDGSSDNTWNKIRQYSTPVKGVKLARNFGHQHALLAGLNESKGDAIISMDGDMQHPPSLIEKGFMILMQFLF